MKKLYIKSLKGCFNTKEYAFKSIICQKCHFQMDCWKERKKRYKTVKPTPQIQEHLLKKHKKRKV